MNEYISIAIDGPSAAGKSTVARELATALGFVYVDTGALYRSIGYYCHTHGIDPKDGEAVTAILPAITVDLRYLEGTQHIFLNGEDVSAPIRLPEISMAASAVSAVPAVRAFLLDLQRDLAKNHSVVMDGRDIGTVVLPDAAVKFFLTATPEARATRRMLEYAEKGQTVPYERLLQETIERDANDSNRAAAPLRQAADAIRIDSTALTLAETIAAMKKVVEEKL